MCGSGRLILEDGSLLEGRLRDGCLHGLARYLGNTCNIPFHSMYSPGDSMKRGGLFGLEGLLLANRLDSAGPL